MIHVITTTMRNRKETKLFFEEIQGFGGWAEGWR